jgi:hypothetical protein
MIAPWISFYWGSGHMSFMESHAFGATASRIVERSLSAEVVRLQKLRLDEALSRSVEEAERLLNIGRYCEAEALLQNADARIRHRETAGLSNTP